MRRQLYYFAIASLEYVPELLHGTDKDETFKAVTALADKTSKEDNIKRVVFYCGKSSSSPKPLLRATRMWQIWKTEQAIQKLKRLEEEIEKKASETPVEKPKRVRKPKTVAVEE